MSCNTNTNRSAGVSWSSTMSRAKLTESASNASCSGVEVAVRNGNQVGQVRGERILPPASAGAQRVQAFPGNDGGQPSAEVADLLRVGPAQLEPGLLNSVVRVSHRAEHPIRHRPQSGSVLLEALGQPLVLVHLHNIPSARLTEVSP
jgi:hypothetical protein